jgi:hypothetical protein
LAVTDEDGWFEIAIHPREFTLTAMNEGRTRGALIRLGKGSPSPVEARLAPLVCLSGTTKLTGGDQPLKWSVVYLNVPYDAENPLARQRIGFCGRYRSRAAFLVPPGEYVLSAFSDAPNGSAVEDLPVTAARGQAVINVGTLVLRPHLSLQERIERAKSRGNWVDYKDNLGKRPPRWHVVDAKGVPKTAQLADFEGKWVVLYIWSPRCAPCLGKQLPELMAFHDAHQSQHDRFEILAFCCDFSEAIASIAELERHLEPVRKNVWGGRDLPFPVLLDNTFQTYVRLGLEGNGVSNILLIDPQGRLVEGDLKMLAAKLASTP